MVRMNSILTLVSLLTMGVSLKAQLAPQPFLPPPRLQEKTGIGSHNLLAFRAANATRMAILAMLFPETGLKLIPE